MYSATPDIPSVRPGSTVQGQRPMLLDRQTPDLDQALFLETFRQKDPATEAAFQDLVKEIGVALDTPPISLAVPLSVLPQAGLAAVTMDAPPMQVHPMLPAAATVLHDTLPPKTDIMLPGSWPTQTFAPRSFENGIPLPTDSEAMVLQNPETEPMPFQAQQEETRLINQGTGTLSPTQQTPPITSLALPDGAAKEAVSHEAPKTAATSLPTGMPDPVEATQATVIVQQPSRVQKDQPNPSARLDPISAGQIAQSVAPTVTGYLRIQSEASPNQTPPMRINGEDQPDHGTEVLARPRHPSVQEHSLRLSAAPSLSIEPAVGGALDAPTPVILAETPFANAQSLAARPPSSALTTATAPNEPAATTEQTPILPTPAIEAINKTTPVMTGDASRPGDPGLALQPVPLATPPSAGSPGTLMPNSPPSPVPSPVQQVTVALVHLAADAPGRIELTLTPETLGRVHFDMRPEGAGLAITVSAEEPGTLDLIRRHLPELMAELRQAGVQAGTLSFGAWAEGQNAPAKAGHSWTEDKGSEPAPPANPLQKHRPTAPIVGLDLRL